MNKAELARLALELRADIGLDAYARLDPYKLADAWGIDVYQLGDLDCPPEAIEHLKTTHHSAFSGALIPVGMGAVILENDGHDPFRRRSTAAHEMAHVALGHAFTTRLVDERGCRASDPELEREAAELGGELLLSSLAARRLAWAARSDLEVAHQYGISVEIARWRMGATGARLIVGRSRAKQTARSPTRRQSR